MKFIISFIPAFFILCCVIAQEVRVNPDGTHTLIYPHGDNLALEVSPDGTHTVVARHNVSTKTGNCTCTESIKLPQRKKVTILFDQNGFKILEYRYKRKKAVYILVKPDGENIILRQNAT